MTAAEFHTAMNVISLVSEAFNISIGTIDSPSRRADLVLARQVIMFLIRKHTGLSSSKIGLILGKDHGTVLMGLKRIEGRIDVEPRLRLTVDHLSRKVRKKQKQEVRGVILKFA